MTQTAQAELNRLEDAIPEPMRRGAISRAEAIARGRARGDLWVLYMGEQIWLDRLLLSDWISE